MNLRMVALAMLSIPCAPGMAQQPAAPTGNVERGRTLYVQTGCYACHGHAGQGAQATGPRLSRTQLPLEAFMVFLRTPVRQMPPYEAAAMPDQDVVDIYAFVKQLPAPRDVEDIPLLRAPR